jgi:hypothetical protein
VVNCNTSYLDPEAALFPAIVLICLLAVMSLSTSLLYVVLCDVSRSCDLWCLLVKVASETDYLNVIKFGFNSYKVRVRDKVASCKKWKVRIKEKNNEMKISQVTYTSEQNKR